MGFETQEVERKTLSILRVLSDSKETLGARVIAHRLKDYGVELGERAVRYHLKLMDERGMTLLVGRDGRIITASGVEELRNALVSDKVGFAISKIELLAFRTDFDCDKRAGLIPVNVSFLAAEKFSKAIHAMRHAFAKGICVSNLVAVAGEGEKIGELIVPPGKVGFATVCSIVINGTLLKAGVPMDSRFGGILEIRDNKPVRFVELINYSGCSLDPAAIFIRAKMTSVRQVANTGNGKILANFREIPSLCRPLAANILKKLSEAGMNALIVMGDTSETVCEIHVELNRIGVVLVVGLNPIAAVEEAGIETENYSMSTIMEYRDLIKFEEVLNERG